MILRTNILKPGSWLTLTFGYVWNLKECFLDFAFVALPSVYVAETLGGTRVGMLLQPLLGKLLVVTSLQCHWWTILRCYSPTAFPWAIRCCYSPTAFPWAILRCYGPTAFPRAILHCYSLTAFRVLYNDLKQLEEQKGSKWDRNPQSASAGCLIVCLVLIIAQRKSGGGENWDLSSLAAECSKRNFILRKACSIVSKMF